MSDMEVENKITLVANDNIEVSVDLKCIVICKTINDMIKDVGEECAQNLKIPLPNVSGEMLNHVVWYCKTYKENEPESFSRESSEYGDKNNDEDEDAYEDPFKTRSDTGHHIHEKWKDPVVQLSHIDRVKLIKAANFLGCDSLKELMTKTLSDDVRGKKAEEICKIMNITCDITPERRKQIEDYWTKIFKETKHMFS